MKESDFECIFYDMISEVNELERELKYADPERKKILLGEIKEREDFLAPTGFYHRHVPELANR